VPFPAVEFRAAILGIADNLIACNHHFQALATQWATQGKERHTRVKVALRLCPIAFQMVAGWLHWSDGVPPAIQGAGLTHPARSNL
jgi:hypothetical protein